jgi:hypothetical protein
VQVWIAGATTVCLTVLLAIQVVGDVQSAKPWYMKFITSWIVVMAGASVIFWRFWRRLEREGLDPREAIFRRLPPE